MNSTEKLDRSFYARNAVEVARDLLGRTLVHHSDQFHYECRIVETEAYVGEKDLACHASKGKTKRTEIMFGPAGFAYVYLIYGIHELLNVVVGDIGDAQAVLIRAAEPIHPPSISLSGPGKLTKQLQIDRRDYGEDFCGNKLFFLKGTPPRKIKRAKRVGVDYAKHWKNRLLRFYDPESHFVSVYE